MPYQVKAELRLLDNKYIPMYDVTYAEPTKPTINLAINIYDPVEAENIVKAHARKTKFIKQYGIVNYDDNGKRLNSLNEVVV